MRERLARLLCLPLVAGALVVPATGCGQLLPVQEGSRASLSQEGPDVQDGPGAQEGPGMPEGSSTAAEKSTRQEPITKLEEDFHNADLGCGWEPTGSMELRYARCYAVDYFADGYALVCVADGNRYLVVPEGGTVPEGLANDIIVLHKPVQNIYLAASDSMCLFEALDALDRITVSGIARDDWHIDAARAAMDAGSIVYGGKYRAPDYELLLARGVQLALESSMINHTPDVREKLMELGIPVLVELSSYESEPLGRAEWIKLYGELCDRGDAALAAFDEQEARVEAIDARPTGKTVAYFYLNANGAAVVRRPGDYVTKMIERAGGTYVFDALDAAQAGSSSTTMEMEQFYATAKNADVIIYNATIDDTLDSLDALIGRNELLADFKAVRSGNVWITEQNMYQQMIATGDIISDINHVLALADADADPAPSTGEKPAPEGELTYLRRLT